VTLSFPGPAQLARLRARIRRAQLRTRVVAGVLAVVLISLAGSGFAAVDALHGYLLNQTDTALRAVASEYRPQMPGLGSAPGAREAGKAGGGKARQISKPPKPTSGTPGISVQLRLPPILDKYYIGLLPRHGQPKAVVEGNRDLVPRLPADLATLTADRAQNVTGTDGHTQLRVLVVPLGGGRTLIAATSLDDLSRTVSHLQLIIIVASLAATLVLVVGVGLVVRRGLRPIESIAGAADRITAGDLTSRVSPDDPATEVGRLGMALNGMLTRIETAVCEQEAIQQATRQFFADASHELRTPLASLRANAELYMQGALPPGTQVDEAMRRITAEAQRMSALVDDMLRLARLDLHPSQRHERVDLTALAADCIERARTAHPQRTWHSRITAGLVTTGDEEMLRRALDNLLANVAAHTPVGTTGTITATARDSTITVEVSDNGPGVPASQLPRVFDRFYRAQPQAHRSGSGLGLAIVAAIATAHHGTAQATLNFPHGLRITLTLPAPSQSRFAQPLPASTTPNPHPS
jgi:two-component system, OmpR family, sensor kinase